MRKLLVLALVVACGGGSEKPDAFIVINVDAPTPDAPYVGPNIVTVRAFSDIAFIRYRDGNGPWQMPDENATGYRLHVTDAYQLMFACTSSQGSEVRLMNRTYGDNNQLFAFCNLSSDSMFTGLQVTAPVQQAGEVFMQDSASSTTAPWTATLNVTPGAHDLLAFSANHRVLIRRDLDITMPTTLATVDIQQDGSPLVPIPLTVNNLGSDAFYSYYDVVLTNDYAFVLGSTPTLYRVPDTLLQGQDFEYLFVGAYTATTDRSASAYFTGVETTFDLMPALQNITFASTGGVYSASWGQLPPYTEMAMQVNLDSSTQTRTMYVSASQSWLDATHTTKLAFDVEPPGFDASWKIATTDPQLRAFTVNDDSGAIGYSSTIYSAANGSALTRTRSRTALLQCLGSSRCSRRWAATR